jgi:hypothetical protein
LYSIGVDYRYIRKGKEMAGNDKKTPRKGDIIVYSYEYFNHVHYDNRLGIITDNDYLTWNKTQLLCILGKKYNKGVGDIVEKYYGNFNDKQVDYIFKEVRYIIHINDFYEEYQDIRKYVFIDCVPDNMFTEFNY